MKAFSLLCALAISASMLLGCSNQQSATSTSSDSSAKTYTNQDLQRTGKRDAGEAVRSVDPAVTTRNY